MLWRSVQRQWRLSPILRHHLQQRATLVNVKLKWVKDRTLDRVVSREKHLRPILHLIASNPDPDIPIPTQNPNFLRRFPAVFHQSSPSAFTLTPATADLRRRELQTLKDTEPDVVNRLRKLLMLTLDRSLPFHTIDLLRFDLGLDLDFQQTLIPRYPQFFTIFQPPNDERLWVKLVGRWDPLLAVSELQRSSGHQKGESLAFPVSFTRGFGLKKKCVEWLKEWQTLPYTSPYEDASGLDPRTDESEKRIVGVFHEILHLMIGKKTERRNVSNMRKVLGLPQKFTKVFERHPGIFYLSRKLATETVVLREGYCGRELVKMHPIVEIREKYLELIRVRKEMENEDDVDEDSDGCFAEYISPSEE